MRWWAVGGMVAGMVVLAACSGSTDGGSAPGPSGSRSAEPSAGAPTHTSASASMGETASPTAGSPSVPASVPSTSVKGCAAGHVKVAVSPGDRVERQLCVRPGTTVSLVLRPRADDKQWTGVQSSAPVFVLVAGWRVDADGTAYATLRCAGTRAGKAKITGLAKAPDVAGAAHGAFTLDVGVVPYPREG
jgi:hypothetical protein